jgi:hypothetical protein
MDSGPSVKGINEGRLISFGHFSSPRHLPNGRFRTQGDA